MGAGEYRHRVTWRARRSNSDPATGAELPYYVLQRALWASVEITDAGRGSQYGSEANDDAATVRVRNRVAINPGDHLVYAAEGERWEVVTVRRGDNETICECTRLAEVALNYVDQP